MEGLSVPAEHPGQALPGVLSLLESRHGAVSVLGWGIPNSCPKASRWEWVTPLP